MSQTGGKAPASALYLMETFLNPPLSFLVFDLNLTKSLKIKYRQGFYHIFLCLATYFDRLAAIFDLLGDLCLQGQGFSL